MRLLRTIVLVHLAACGPKPQTQDAAGSTSAGPPATTEATTTPTPTPTEGSGSSSTATTEQTTGLATTTATGMSTGFMGLPDVPAEPGGCDPHAEMPCPEGQKCSAASESVSIYTGTPTCVPILGDKQHGESCDLGANPIDGLDDCAAGLVCVDIALNFNFPAPGVCVEFCDPPFYWDVEAPFTCTDPTEFCFVPGCQDCYLSFCTPTCDPLAPDCQDETICAFYNNAFLCLGTYAGIELPGVGEPCGDFFECTTGAECVSAELVAAPACAGEGVCCTAFCDLNAPNICPGKEVGETCQPYFPEPFDPIAKPWGVQYNKLGFCSLP